MALSSLGLLRLITKKRELIQIHASLADNNHSQRIRAVAIRGVKSSYPCPICLVHKNELWDLSRTWEPRTQEDSAQVIHAAQTLPTKKAKDDMLLTRSLRAIQVLVFIDIWFSSNVATERFLPTSRVLLLHIPSYSG